MKSTSQAFGICAAIFVTVLALLYVGSIARASVALDTPTPEGIYVVDNFFATTSPQTVFATTTTATSTNVSSFMDDAGRLVNGTVNIAGAKKVTVYFSRGGSHGANTGSTLFRIETTRDGTNWQTFDKLVQATSSTQQATATITAATSTLSYGLDLTFVNFKAIRCIVVETTDGEHSCAVAVQF